MADAVRLPLTAEDVAEVTHRLNAFLDALAPLEGLPAEAAEPLPAPVDPDRAL